LASWEGVLSKDMAAIGEYLQTWKLKLSTTAKMVSAVFHHNSKEAKHELKSTIVKSCPSALSPNTLE